MTIKVSRPLPLYRKLLLENKILVFIAVLFGVLGLTALTVMYWVTRDATEAALLDGVAASLAVLEVAPGERSGAREELASFAPDDGSGPASAGSLPLLESGGDETKSELVPGTRLAFLESVARGAAVEDAPGLSRLLSTALAGMGAPIYMEVRGRDGQLLAAAQNRDPRIDDSDFDPAGAAVPRRAERALRLAHADQPAGELIFGLESPSGLDRANRAVALVLSLMVLPMLLALVVARLAVRRTVEPLKQLTHVADEISMGNLDPRIDFGERVNCWDIKNCHRTDCTAYMNLSRQCWYVDGTPCEGYEPRFPQKLAQCRTCEVYQAHRGDEIVQLADAFRHMTNVLKETQGELLKSDDFQKRLIRNSFDGIVATDAEDKITIFNRVAEGLTGWDRTEVIGVADWRAFFEDGLERMMDRPLSWGRDRRVRGFPPRDAAILRRDQHLVHVRLAGISLYEHGRHIGRVFFFQDMREIKQLREDLIHSERLAATGQAAAGISHSIRNILDGFRGGLFVVQHGKKTGDEQKVETGLNMIERNMEIISDLVKDLLNFAKVRHPVYAPVKPEELFADVFSGIGQADRERVNLDVEIAGDAGLVQLDAHAFRQCIGNLVRNAIEAIPRERKGSVRVGYQIEGDRAIFTVRDDGEGMSEDTREKIQRGMYSTKGSKGTGLGFLVIQKVIEEHAGHLSIESAEGKGAEFRIDIPVNGQ